MALINEVVTETVNAIKKQNDSAREKSAAHFEEAVKRIHTKAQRGQTSVKIDVPEECCRLLMDRLEQAGFTVVSFPAQSIDVATLKPKQTISISWELRTQNAMKR